MFDYSASFLVQHKCEFQLNTYSINTFTFTKTVCDILNLLIWPMIQVYFSDKNILLYVDTVVCRRRYLVIFRDEIYAKDL